MFSSNQSFLVEDSKWGTQISFPIKVFFSVVLECEFVRMFTLYTPKSEECWSRNPVWRGSIGLIMSHVLKISINSLKRRQQGCCLFSPNKADSIGLNNASYHVTKIEPAECINWLNRTNKSVVEEGERRRSILQQETEAEGRFLSLGVAEAGGWGGGKRLKVKLWEMGMAKSVKDLEKRWESQLSMDANSDHIHLPSRLGKEKQNSV